MDRIEQPSRSNRFWCGWILWCHGADDVLVAPPLLSERRGCELVLSAAGRGRWDTYWACVAETLHFIRMDQRKLASLDVMRIIWCQAIMWQQTSECTTHRRSVEIVKPSRKAYRCNRQDSHDGRHGMNGVSSKDSGSALMAALRLRKSQRTITSILSVARKIQATALLSSCRPGLRGISISRCSAC